MGAQLDLGTLMARVGMDYRQLQDGAQASTRIIYGLHQQTKTPINAKAYVSTDQLKRDEAEVQAVFGNLRSAASQLAVAFASIGVSIGAVSIFSKMTVAASEFEHTMLTVAGVMRVTNAEFESLIEKSEQMSMDSTKGPTDMAHAFYFLASAGMNMQQAMTALPGVVNLAKVGVMDLGAATDIAISVMRGMALQAEDLARANDVMVGTFTRTNTMLSTLAETFIYAIPLGHAYGYTLDEISGLAGILGNAGVRGSMAGTQLAMAFEKANEAARDFGFKSADLIDVLEAMRARGMTTADVMDQFGIRAGRAALILWNNIDAARELQATLRETAGEAATLSLKMSDSVQSSWNRVKAAMTSIGVQAFERYKSALKDVLDATHSWLVQHENEVIAMLTVLGQAMAVGIKLVTGLLELLAEIPGAAMTSWSALDAALTSSHSKITRSTHDIMEALKPPKMTLWDEFWDNLASGFMDLLTNVKNFMLDVIATIFGFLRMLGSMIITVSTMAATIVSTIASNGLLGSNFKVGPQLKNDLDAFAADFQLQMDQYGQFMGKHPINVNSNPTFQRQQRIGKTMIGEYWDAAQIESQKAWERFKQQTKGMKPEDLQDPWMEYVSSRFAAIDKYKAELMRLGMDADDAQKRANILLDKLDQQMDVVFVGSSHFKPVSELTTGESPMQKELDRKKKEAESKAKADQKAFEDALKKARVELPPYPDRRLETGAPYNEGLLSYSSFEVDQFEKNAAGKMAEWRRSMIELTRNTADGMSTAFSDYFFDAMAGKLRSFRDVWTSTLQLIYNVLASAARALSNQMGDALASVFVSAITGSLSGGGGALIDSGTGGGVTVPGIGPGAITPPNAASFQAPAVLATLRGAFQSERVRASDRGGSASINVTMNLQNVSDQRSFSRSNTRVARELARQIGLGVNQ